MIKTHWKAILSITLLLAFGAILISYSVGHRSVGVKWNDCIGACWN